MYYHFKSFLATVVLVALLLNVSSYTAWASSRASDLNLRGVEYVAVAWNLPQSVYDHGPDSIKPLVQAALKVGEYNRYLIGTLSYSRGGDVTYSSKPTDRLRLIASNGAITDYYVQYFQGYLAEGASSFMRNNYLVMFRKVTNDFDLTVLARQEGRTAVVEVTGTMKWEGATYDVKAIAQGSFYFESDSTGMQYETTTILSGTVSRPSFVLSLDDKYAYTLVSSSDLSASRSVRTVKNQWTADGKSYAIRDGVFGRSFRNGKPAHLNSEWNARGAIWEGNRRLGEISSQKIGSVFRIAAKWAQGEVVLQSINL